MERALIEGEHELVFKDILKASESDQSKLRELYRTLQILIEGMLTEKTSVSDRSTVDFSCVFCFFFFKASK